MKIMMDLYPDDGWCFVFGKASLHEALPGHISLRWMITSVKEACKIFLTINTSTSLNILMLLECGREREQFDGASGLKTRTSTKQNRISYPLVKINVGT